MLPLSLKSPTTLPIKFPHNHTTPTQRELSYAHRTTLRIQSSKRRGKQRYPSELKKLKKSKSLTPNVPNKFQGIWRFSKLSVSVDNDPGKDSTEVNDAVLVEIAKVLQFPVAIMLPAEAFTVVRKSFDARKILKEPKFVYTVDMDVGKLLSLEPRMYEFVSELEPKVGVVEHMLLEKHCNDLVKAIYDTQKLHENMAGCRHNKNTLERLYQYSTKKTPKVTVVGSGPSGLFASLVLAELGADVTLMERGQPVEQRGRDIGALVVRKIMQEESNFCFGEGGAGTWSDGKLVTRIGRNSRSVLAVMKTLVRFGAPESILVDGKPHLGTDRLVPLLKNFRQHLLDIGVTIKFGTRVDDLIVEDSQVVGVKFSDLKGKCKLGCDAVVLAVGHSARDVYEMLLSHNVHLDPKDFSVGLRIEHPQELINSIQLSALAAEVCSGRGKVPVADYKLAKSVVEEDWDSSSNHGANRSCYSFCMCPGGQVVLTSTNPAELCINGMSFSRRSSRWANAALAVTVSAKDFDMMGFHGPLAGVEFQREFERRAALMGGGDFVVPVQTVPDFFEGKISVASLPPSSYRLGVKAAKLHELFPRDISDILRHSITMFDAELPGFISKQALLHGVETRTSSPVKIGRSSDTYESTSLKGLYPVGEGAGYAGGIVSAAVDGMYGGLHVAKNLGINVSAVESVFGKAQGAAIVRH